MVRALLVLAAIPAALGAHGSQEGVAAARVTPINKVIQLLNGMLDKGASEKHAEEVAFSEFSEWCSNMRDTKNKAIGESKDQIVQLKADIDKTASDAEILAEEVKELEAAIASDKAEKGSAQEQRHKENADFQATDLDYSESIDACERATAVLKAKAADVPQSLMQVRDSKIIPAQAKALITSFLAMQGSDEAGVPEANSYEFQSGGVVDLLEKLTGRFKEERLASQKAELNAKNNFQVLLQQLEDNIAAAEDTVSKKTSARAGELDANAEAKGDLVVTTKALAEDSNVLDETNAECRMKSEEFEKNQVVRGEEMEAIKKAIEIVSSDDVKGAGETHLPAALLQRKATSLAQLRSSRSEGNPATRKQAAAYLQAQAKKLNSRYLSVMANRVKEDPFGKVKSMIKNLIVKLMEEANEEADKNGYCTTELATNKATREEKSSETDELTSEVDELTATSAQLGNEITQLADSISDIRKSQGEAQKIRTDDKAANTKTIEDAKTAQVAVEKAIEVLRTFYDKAAEGSSFVQAKAKAPYTGMQGGSGGIMGLLEVILSDFARLESATSSSEDQGASGFEKYMDDSSEDLAVKSTEKEHKEAKKQRTEEDLRRTKKELGLTQEELTAALGYYDKLKGDCVDSGLSYETRTKTREEEIESLKQALTILSS